MFNITNERLLAHEIAEQRWGLSKIQITKLSDNDDVPKASAAIIDIYNSLNILFENRLQEDSWIHRPNQYFDGKTALKVILNEVQGIKSVQDY